MEKVKVLLLGDSPIAQYALSLLKDYDVLNIGDSFDIPPLPKDWRPNIAFSIKYPHILSKNFIDKIGASILNFHTAPLPELRGVDTCSWAIVHKLKRFGVTVHIIEEKVDSGLIVFKRTYPIKKWDTAYSLYQKNLILLKKIIKKNIVKFVKGEYMAYENECEVSFFHKKGEFDYSNLKVPKENQDIFIRSRFFPGKQLPYYE